MSDDALFPALDADPERDLVVAAFRSADPDGARAGRVFRETLDQLYDGQRTGRYRWDQLYKTEKTHFGTLIEINLRREFTDVIVDGDVLDYRVKGIEIDCKYSQALGQWMLPPECFGHLLLVAHASDIFGEWSLGVVRASDENRRQTGANRDAKVQLNPRGRTQVDWLFKSAPLAPNVLLHLDHLIIEKIMRPKSGQARVNELLRTITGTRIGRNTIATVGQQADYMKRVRYNGGARSALQSEGIIILGGDYSAHTGIARALGATVPEPGEVVSLRVVPASDGDTYSIDLDGRAWRLARPDETPTEAAPKVPEPRKKKADN